MSKELQTLPIGIQSFEMLRRDGLLYVDKTHRLQEFILSGKRYFLSRPRRFGKSLTLSTLDAMFQGKAELFKVLPATTEPHLSNLVLTLRQGSPIILEVLGVFAVFCRTESPPFFPIFPRMGWPMQVAFALENTHSTLDFFLSRHNYRACVFVLI